MTIRTERGSAAVIAMVILAITGLTVTSYVTSATSAAAADAATVAGWRAQYATDSGIAVAISAVSSGATTASVPLSAGVPSVAIAGSRSLGFSFAAVSAQSQRRATAWVTIGTTGRPIVTSWRMYTGTLVTNPPPEDAYGNGNGSLVITDGDLPPAQGEANGNGNGNNGNGNGNGGGGKIKKKLN